MARRVFTRLVDDIDGTASDDVGTVAFGLDGVSYEIDLTSRNARELRARLAAFLPHAKEVGARPKRARSGVANRRKERGEQMKAIREWARGKGHRLSDRGRMPAHIVVEFNRAHGR